MDEPGGDGLLGEFFAPEIEAFEEVGGDGFAGFDLDGVEGVRGCLDEGIDLVAFLVAEEVEGGLGSVVGLGFEQLGHDPVLEECATLGMGGEVSGPPHSKQPSGQARVGEVELGRFDQALGGVGEPRADEQNEVAGFEDGQPGFRSDPGDACIGGERGDVYQLADASGAELDETLEGGEILDVENLTHIALKVGADVVLEPDGGLDRAVVDRREEATVKEVIDCGWGAADRLQFS